MISLAKTFLGWRLLGGFVWLGTIGLAASVFSAALGNGLESHRIGPKSCLGPEIFHSLARSIMKPSSSVQHFSQRNVLVDSQASKDSGVTSTAFGKTQDGHDVTKFTLRNSKGTTVEMLDFGATLDAVHFADRDGKIENVVLNTDTMAKRELHAGYFGSTVGRFCNRIAHGEFTLDGVAYQLAKNNGHNHLHGGDYAYDKMVWKAEVIEEAGHYGVQFHLHSPDGDEGYPGNLDLFARYVLNDKDELLMDFQAKTDKSTPINITNHAYWNLGGCKSGNILQHQLKLNATKYLEVDDGLIPTGRLLETASTPLDFQSMTPIGKNIDQVNQTAANGFDHCFAVDGPMGELRLAATVVDPMSGRKMEVLTTQPGIQLYTANHLDGGSGCCGFVKNGGFCLETQNYPDAPNKPDFPSSILKPGDTYHHQTIHRFSVDGQ